MSCDDIADRFCSGVLNRLDVRKVPDLTSASALVFAIL